MEVNEAWELMKTTPTDVSIRAAMINRVVANY